MLENELYKQYFPYVVLIILVIFGFGIYTLFFSSQNIKDIVSNLFTDLPTLKTNAATEANTQVVTKTESEITVEIAGAIKNPGMYTISSPRRLGDLVKMSGGFSDNVYVLWIGQKLNLASVLKDGQKIYIPFKWDANFNVPLYDLEDISINTVADLNIETIQTSESVGDEVLGLTNIETENSNKIDINTATKEQLMTLSGIGESYATKIINARPYTKIDELVSKAKLSQNLLNKITTFITL